MRMLGEEKIVIISMVKFKVDLSDTAYFNGITINYDNIIEGLDYAKRHSIKRVLIKSEEQTKHRFNFEIFRDYDFITTLHWIVPLSKLSDIQGLYSLKKLTDFRWGPASDIPIDLSAFPNLKILSIVYNNHILGWDSLNKLERLFLMKVTTCDLSFLYHDINLEYLRILRGKITSIYGIDNCSKLKTLFLQSCNLIKTLEPTIFQLNLDRLNIEKCSNLELDNTLFNNIENISIL